MKKRMAIPIPVRVGNKLATLLGSISGFLSISRKLEIPSELRRMPKPINVIKSETTKIKN
ncbi:MAG TPA: hypothetical protein ENG34_00485 [Candidatus Aenigmarchaeota archaeon]|nr:hypothetical protein [Candidatus Aenigmarchaeota archaeon]